MRSIVTLPVLLLIFSCGANRPTATGSNGEYAHGMDTLITQPLFNDKSASISEENIQRLLDGNYKLPAKLRVAVVRLDNNSSRRLAFWKWIDNDMWDKKTTFVTKLLRECRPILIMD